MKKFGVLGLVILTFLAFLVLGSTAQSIADAPKPPEPPKSSMKAPTLYSEVLQLDWNYSVYLPVGYDDEANANKVYPVVYLLHGAFGNHRNLVERFPVQKIIDDLIAANELQECIVVFPDGFNSYYINGPAFNMEDAFVNDFFPAIEKTYRVDARKEARFIGGISMGGYGASRFALKYPEMFNSALLISPAVWEKPQEGNAVYDLWHVFKDGDKNFSQEVWEQYYPQGLIDSYADSGSKVDFFVITGDADEVVDVSEVQAFAGNLEKAANVTLTVEPEGVHAWTFWEGATKKALQFAGEKMSGVK